MNINQSDLLEKSWYMDTITTNSLITYKITTATTTTTTTKLDIFTVTPLLNEKGLPLVTIIIIHILKIA